MSSTTEYLVNNANGGNGSKGKPGGDFERQGRRRWSAEGRPRSGGLSAGPGSGTGPHATEGR